MPRFEFIDLPATDEEAEEALQRLSFNKLAGTCLVGIFQCRRAEGQSLLDAYEAALLAAGGESQKVKADA